MAIDGRGDWLDRTALKGRIEQQLEDMRLVKVLLREGLVNRQHVKTALTLQRQNGISLATSLLLSGGISLDALTHTLQSADRTHKP